ncbi:ribokinase [Phenylobacterium aquaticum]|uniref:ribokinase n=1 Tax=Phenylobacterium aquaticum TaxID=1763816 RepID=UPI001F5D83DC|nr:ribokinase [Phenylobacterium aquaticum]MCI3132376.1 ribokinase [Phenylobacterium aquaticum]
MSVCVLGGINLDHVATVEALPAPGETVTSSRLERFPGGKAGNQAVAAARAGAATRLLGAVGDDEPGAYLRGFLAEAGVDLRGVITVADAPTGQAFITLDTAGRNSIVVAPGANARYGAAEVAAANLSGATVFLTQFEATLPAVEALFLSPEALGGVKILNAAPALAAGARLLALADILVVNETELARFAGLSQPPADAETAAAAALTLAGPGQAVIATLGGDGAVIVRDGEVMRVPGRRAEVVDTTGAGDCFCGALAARLSAGDDLERAVIYANAAAALSVTRAGAATSSPSQAEVEALLAG